MVAVSGSEGCSPTHDGVKREILASGDSTNTGPTESDEESGEHQDVSQFPLVGPTASDLEDDDDAGVIDKRPMSDDSDDDSSFTLELPGDCSISEQRRKRRKLNPILQDRMRSSGSATPSEDCTEDLLIKNLKFRTHISYALLHKTCHLPQQWWS